MNPEPENTVPAPASESLPPADVVADTNPAAGPARGPGAKPSEDRADSVFGEIGKRIVAHPLGKLMAVIIGVLFGLAIETGVGATGILGPGVDQLIAEQAEGFENLEAKLEALRNTSDPAQAAKLAGEMEALLARQQQIGQRTETELRAARAEIEKLRAEVLESRGATSGADVWLQPGESITIAGKAGSVFSFDSFSYSGRTSDITVNASGERGQLKVGDSSEFPASNGVWRVIYKTAAKRSDGRVGFDVVFVPNE